MIILMQILTIIAIIALPIIIFVGIDYSEEKRMQKLIDDYEKRYHKNKKAWLRINYILVQDVFFGRTTLKLNINNRGDSTIKKIIISIVCYNCIHEKMFERKLSSIGYIQKNETRFSTFALNDILSSVPVDHIDFISTKVQNEDGEVFTLSESELSIEQNPDVKYSETPAESIKREINWSLIGYAITLFIIFVIWPLCIIN